MTKKTLLDAVGTTGGKATVETRATWVNKAGHLKPWKSGPKQYKKGPGPTGKDRLQRSVNSLLQAASRLDRKEQGSDDGLWARRLVEALMAFNAQEVVGSGPRLDQTELIELIKPVHSHLYEAQCTVCHPELLQAKRDE